MKAANEHHTCVMDSWGVCVLEPKDDVSVYTARTYATETYARE